MSKGKHKWEVFKAQAHFWSNAANPRSWVTAEFFSLSAVQSQLCSASSQGKGRRNKIHITHRNPWISGVNSSLHATQWLFGENFCFPPDINHNNDNKIKQFALRSYFPTRIFEKLNRESSPEEKQLLPSQADLSCCKKKGQFQWLQHSSVTYRNWCKREKCCCGSHKEPAHSVPQWLCGPCWAEFPLDNFLYVLEFNLQPDQGFMCCFNSMEKSFWESWWCPVLSKFPVQALMLFLKVLGDSLSLGSSWTDNEGTWGHRYFLIYFLPSHHFTLAKMWEFVVSPPIFVSHAEKTFWTFFVASFFFFFFFCY